MSVAHALLALLSEGPSFGLRLRQEFEARTGEVWPLNVGQVYTTLQRLERDGLVESDGGESDGPQKHYRITPTGAGELAAWLRTPPDTSSVVIASAASCTNTRRLHDVCGVSGTHTLPQRQRPVLSPDQP
jgi:DNA-binding PadR family transcriptional regulator